MNINNKTICVLLHGRSLEELENRIEDFKDLDVCWGGMSSFDIEEEYILKKINKEFTVVFDSSTVENAEEYELNVRLPRLSKYLNRPTNNFYICTKTDKNNLCQLRERIASEFNKKYKDKIIYAENLRINPIPFCVSLHLYIACLSNLGYDNIILFGADGGGKWGNSIESYYKWELVKKDKEICGNLSYNMIGDSNNINSTYKNLLNNAVGFVPTVMNCSPGTTYTVFQNISYDKVLEYLRRENE